MAAKTSKVYQSVSKCVKDVLEGTLIAFDPSTGSQSSMPGYAVFVKGELVESGIIKVNASDRKNVKLYEISISLRTEFPKADVIAIENIPPVSYNRKGAMRGWAIVALQRSIGAIMASFNCEYIEVAPASWQRYKFPGYDKSDEHDAICIGLTCIDIAKQITKEKKGEE